MTRTDSCHEMTWEDFSSEVNPDAFLNYAALSEAIRPPAAPKASNLSPPPAIVADHAESAAAVVSFPESSSHGAVPAAVAADGETSGPSDGAVVDAVVSGVEGTVNGDVAAAAGGMAHVGTTPSMAVDERNDICVICQDDLSGDLITLWCMHKFHRSCIMEWRDVSRKSEEQCPYRCETSQQLVSPLQFLGSFQMFPYCQLVSWQKLAMIFLFVGQGFQFSSFMISDLGLTRLARDDSDWAIVDAEAEGNRLAAGAAEASREVEGAF